MNWFILLVTMALPVSTYAQVYKCTVAGKTVYQQVPCTGEGKSVDLTNAAPPSPQALQEANYRAMKDADQIREDPCVEASRNLDSLAAMARAKTLCKNQPMSQKRSKACLEASRKPSSLTDMARMNYLCGN